MTHQFLENPRRAQNHLDQDFSLGHTVYLYIRTVSSYCLLSALLNWSKLVYGLFGHSNCTGIPRFTLLMWGPKRKTAEAKTTEIEVT